MTGGRGKGGALNINVQEPLNGRAVLDRCSAPPNDRMLVGVAGDVGEESAQAMKANARSGTAAIEERM